LVVKLSAPGMFVSGQDNVFWNVTIRFVLMTKLT
jgi:hypothetical protein